MSKNSPPLCSPLLAHFAVVVVIIRSHGVEVQLSGVVHILKNLVAAVPRINIEALLQHEWSLSVVKSIIGFALPQVVGLLLVVDHLHAFLVLVKQHHVFLSLLIILKIVTVKFTVQIFEVCDLRRRLKGTLPEQLSHFNRRIIDIRQ